MYVSLLVDKLPNRPKPVVNEGPNTFWCAIRPLSSRAPLAALLFRHTHEHTHAEVIHIGAVMLCWFWSFFMGSDDVPTSSFQSVSLARDICYTLTKGNTAGTDSCMCPV